MSYFIKTYLNDYLLFTLPKDINFFVNKKIEFFKS